VVRFRRAPPNNGRTQGGVTFGVLQTPLASYNQAQFNRLTPSARTATAMPTAGETKISALATNNTA